MNKVIYLFLFLFLLTPDNLVGQVETLDAFVQQEQEIENFPGVAACVVKKGQIVWSGAYGVQEYQDNNPVTTETLFTIASLTKLFTSTAIIQLVEDGLINLDDDINNYLPFEIKNPHFPNSVMTVSQLLQHRSSLRDPESLLFTYQEQGDPTYPLETYVFDYLNPEGATYTDQIYNTENGPGLSQWYSNLGFATLGVMIQEASGLSYEAYIEERILEPLCMSKSTFRFANVDLEEMAMPHAGTEPLSYYGIPNLPAALLKSNVEELANFLIAYTNRGFLGDFQLLSQESADLLTPLSFEEENLGWWNGTTWTFTAYAPMEEVWFHGGFMPGIRCRMNYYPQDSSGIIILTNGQGTYRYIEDTLQKYIPEFSFDPEFLNCNEEAPSGIAHNEAKESLQLFPNPASDFVFIGIKESLIDRVEIFDINGKRVELMDFPENSFGTKKIDLSFLTSGNYLISVRTKNGLVYQERFAIFRK